MTHHHRESDIPDWDGRPETWEDFRIRTTAYVRQADPWKEGQQISKIIGKMGSNPSSKPWKLIQALSDEERDKLITKSALLDFLRLHLLESAIPELGRNFRAWIKIKRENKESMRLYIMRHRQVLSKMEKSLNESKTASEVESKLHSEVDRERLKILTTERTKFRTPPRSPTPSYTGRSPTRSQRPASGPHTPEPTRPRVWGRAREHGRTADDWQSQEPDDEEHWDEQWEEVGSALPHSPQREKDWGNWQGKWGSSWEGWSDNKVKHVPKERLDELAETIAKIAIELEPEKQSLITTLINQVAARWRDSIIPDTLLGYHLLISSQLSPSERSTIISTTQMAAGATLVSGTTVASGINLNRVETALLHSWQDKELMERDDREARKASKRSNFSQKKGRAFAADDCSDDSDNSAGDQPETNTLKVDEGSESNLSEADANALENMSEPELAEEWACALNTKYEAKRQFRGSKRTYHQAREHVRTLRKKRFGPSTSRAHAVLNKKLKNPFHKPSSSSQPSSSTGSNSVRICYKCGEKGHIAAECSKKTDTGSKSNGKSFVVFTVAMADASESESDSPSGEEEAETAKPVSIATSSKVKPAPSKKKDKSPPKRKPSRGREKEKSKKKQKRSRSKSKASSTSSTNSALLRKREQEVERLRKQVARLERAAAVVAEEKELKRKMRDIEKKALEDKEVGKRYDRERRTAEAKKDRKERHDRSHDKAPKVKEERHDRSHDTKASSSKDLVDDTQTRGRRRTRSPRRSPTPRRPQTPERRRPRTPERPPRVRASSSLYEEETPDMEEEERRIRYRVGPLRLRPDLQRPPPLFAAEPPFLMPTAKRAAMIPRSLVEKGPAPPPFPAPSGHFAQFGYNYDEDVGPYHSKGKGKSKGKEKGKGSGKGLEKGQEKSARDWKEWRKDLKEKKRNPTDGYKFFENYEAPVPPGQILKTHVPRDESDSQRADLDVNRAENRRYRVKLWGNMTGKRRRMLKSGKLKPKRSRTEIMVLPIWPRKMKRVFEAVPMNGPEARVLKEINERRTALRELLNRDNTAGVSFLRIRDGSPDSRDPHAPRPVESLTDNEDHWFSSPDNEENNMDDPPSSPSPPPPKVVPKQEIKVELSPELPAPLTPGLHQPECEPQWPEGPHLAPSPEKENPEADYEETLNREESTASGDQTTIVGMTNVMVEICDEQILSTATQINEAIVDSGATASIMSLRTAESLSNHVLNVDTSVRKRFRTASGDVLQSMSLATFHLKEIGEVAFHIVDNAETPTLIGMSALQDATLNFSSGTLHKGGRAIKLGRNSSGHYILNLE